MSLKDFSVEQVAHLLLKRCLPRRVLVKMSRNKYAGSGVFAAAPLKVGSALCFYPGVYTPSVPPWARSVEGEITLLDPRHEHLKANAYLMNLPELGGYIDGLALEAVTVNGAMANPHAVGHLVNHPNKDQSPNARVVPFFWRDMILQFSREISSSEYFPIPNAPFKSNRPWNLAASDVSTGARRPNSSKRFAISVSCPGLM